MPTKRNAAGDLAEKMLPVLEAQRSLGPASYPLTLRRLGELTDPAASAELVLQAAAKRNPFGSRTLAARAKCLDAPLALVEDSDHLASASLTLDFLLNERCAPGEPLCDVGSLKKGLPPKLRTAFEKSVQQRVERGDLPVGVGFRRDKRKLFLYLDRFPPPEPPEVVLAAKLIETLKMFRAAADGSYPITFARLVEATRPGADSNLVEIAISVPTFAAEVIFAFRKKGAKQRTESPVALAADRDLLVESPLLLEAAVRSARSNVTQAVTEADLKKQLSATLTDSFRAALARRLQSAQMPASVGTLLQRKKPLFFLMSDLRNAGSVPPTPSLPMSSAPSVRATVPVAPSSVAADFARVFDEAFERLDRQRGHNFVSLVDLRRALTMDRQSFDVGLQGLRRAGRFTLSGAEGRDGISPEEIQAGIREDGALLLYVSRRLA